MNWSIFALVFFFAHWVVAQRGFTKENPASSCEDVARDNCDATTSYYWLRDANQQVSLYKCNMDLDGGGYTEIAYVDLSQSTNDNDCSRLYARWEQTSVERGDTPPTRCRLDRFQVVGGACEGAYFNAPHQFRRVMGQAKIYARGTPDAFGGEQIDGLQIIASTGEPAWVFATAYGINGVGQGFSSRYCPCENPDFALDNSASVNLDFASNRWSCDGRSSLTDNVVPLFGSTACSPVRSRFFDRFQQSLGANARGLNVKLCRDQDANNEDISFNFINLFVRPSTSFNRTAVCRSPTSVAPTTPPPTVPSDGAATTTAAVATVSTQASVCETTLSASTCKACLQLAADCSWCAALDFGGRCVANCTDGVPLSTVGECPPDEGMPWLLSTTTRPLASIEFTTPRELVIVTHDGAGTGTGDATEAVGDGGDNQGLIIGVVVGVLCALLLVALLVFVGRRYARSSGEGVALVDSQSPLPSPRVPMHKGGSVATIVNEAYDPVGTTLAAGSLREPHSTATGTVPVGNVAVAKSSSIAALGAIDAQLSSARYDHISLRNPPTFGTPTFTPPTDLLVGGHTVSVAGGTAGDATGAVSVRPVGYDVIPAYDHIPDAPDI